MESCMGNSQRSSLGKIFNIFCILTMHFLVWMNVDITGMCPFDTCIFHSQLIPRQIMESYMDSSRRSSLGEIFNIFCIPTMHFFLNECGYRKVGCAHFDMCILHSQLIDLDPKTHFVQYYLKIASYFLSWGKNKYMTLGMQLLWKYIRKSKSVYQKQVHFLLYNFPNIVNLKLKFWVIMRKVYGL